MKNKADLGFHALTVATGVALSYLLYVVFFLTPQAQDAAGGFAQKIFYIHVPSAYALYVSGIVCFVGSAAYLLNPTDARNALAQSGAEIAAVFGLIVLTTGPLWAKKAWGVYWVWEPRLVTTMLAYMIYMAVVVLRSFAGDGEAERKFAAALGVLGTVNLPIIHYAVKKWGGVHPRIIDRGSEGLHPDMWYALYVGFVTLSLLAVLLLWYRTTLITIRARLRNAEELALEQGYLDG